MQKRRIIAGNSVGVRSFTMFWAMGLILFLIAVPVFAQLATGTILGVVKDTSGGTVAGANVTVTNSETTQSRTVTTNDDGSYRFPGMPVGHYSVKIEKDGFKTSTQTGLILDVSQEVVANASMEVGSSAQEVVVTGEAPLVNTTTSALGGLVDEQKMADLPLNGRNYMDLSLMQPGVSRNAAMGNSHGTVGVWYSSNGAPTRSNMVSLDGANMMTLLGGAATSEAGTTLGVDGIREYKVVTTSFSAEYGQSMGSQMLMVSKGGSNQFHGDAFEYIRNSALDSKNFFDTAASSGGRRLPEFQKNNFGGSFGGPIKKDKTFFYGVYEGVRQNVGFTAVDTVPEVGCHGTAGQMIWNGVGTIQSGWVGDCPALGGSSSAETTITSAVATGTTTPFIPAFLALYPMPNVSANCPIATCTAWSGPFTNRAEVNYGQIRVDQNISASDSFFSRYTIDDTILNNANSAVGTATTGTAFPQFGLFASGRNEFLTLAENHIFSPTVLDTTRLSFSRTTVTDRNTYTPNPGDPPLDSPQYQLVQGEPMGIIVLSGFSGPGGNSGFGPPDDGQIQTVYTLSNDLFYTQGKHALKFGLLVNRYDQGIDGGLRTEGQVTFPTMANFLTGTSSTWIGHKASTTPLENYNRYYVFNTFGMYAQDDYRATSRLTLNMGLRYEFMTTPTETNGRSYALRNVWTDAATTQGPPINNYSLRNFSPRVGFAWDPTGSGKMSLRGAFGIYYDIGNVGVTLEQALLGTSPLIITCTVTNASPAAIQVPLIYSANGNCATLFTNQYNAQQPHTLQYNLTADRQLPFGMGLTVSYVGLRGIHLYANREGNPTRMGLTPNSGFGANVLTETVNGQEYFSSGVVTCANVVPSCRMNPNFDAMQYVQTSGDSYYNSLQVVLNKRLGHGLELQSAYTYSQNLDTTASNMDGNDCGSGGATGFDPLNPQNDKGPSCADVRNNWRFNLLYHAPNLIKSEGFAGKLLNGWWMGNIISAQGGYPFTPTLTSNRSESGVFNGLTGQGDRPDIVTAATAGPGIGVKNGVSTNAFDTFVPYDPKTVILGTPTNWYNPLMFDLPPVQACPGDPTPITSTSLTCGTLGNMSRGFLRGPNLFDWDFSVVKDTKLGFLGEQGSLQFRAEFFNILNHTNFGFPSTGSYAGTPTDTCAVTVSCAGGTNWEAPSGASATKPMGTAGQITTTATNSRQIQLALKIIF
jgi:hypothetical protein